MELRLSGIVGGGYDAFWNDQSRWRVLKGGKGSKKSTTTALNLIYRLMRYPGANLLVVRQVAETHRQSTYAQLKWAQARLGVSHLWRCTVSPMEMTYLPTGQKILFRGFDDVLKLASATVETGYLCWVWIEEAYEIASEADFDTLDLSAPRGRVPPPLFKQTTLTFNPWRESHWLKKRFFDAPRPGVATYSTTYHCNEFLDETDRAVFAQLQAINPRRYAVAGLGEWGVEEGLVFENWEVLAFDKSRIGFAGPVGAETDERWKYRHVFGLDYGYSNDPTAFIAAAVNKVDHIAYLYDEFYETHLLNRDIARKITQMGYAKERIRADSANPKDNADLISRGLTRIAPCKKAGGGNYISGGIAAIQEYRLIVHPNCKNTIRELSSYTWRTDAAGKATNRPEDKNNHLMDALRYAFEDVAAFRPAPPRKRPRVEDRQIVLPEDLIGGWS